jgi:hypothetical protein
LDQPTSETKEVQSAAWVCPAPWVRLPLPFDAGRLATDLANVKPDEWQPHYNRADYDGDWSGIALRSATGASTELFNNPNTSTFVDTPVLERCPYFREAISRFECPLRAVRLLRLGPGARILEHTDFGLKYCDGDFRLHIPIATNPETDFVVAGRRLPLIAGEAWYIDFSLPHRIFNRGATDRVHLVIDGKVNQWAHSLILSGERPATTAAPPDSDFSEFREIVFGDPDLQGRLLSVSGQDRFFQFAVSLGRERGFTFTAVDVEVAYRSGKRCWIERATDF